MVAVTISAGLLLAGRLLLDQISAAEHVIITDTAAYDTTMAHALFLRSLIRNLEVGPDSLTPFDGNEQITQFTSWCVDTTAQRTRCLVRLTIDTTLTVVTSLTPLAVLRRMTQGGQFRYLGDARNGGQWYRSWGPGITVPLAIGVIIGSDTTVLRIGERE
jgi:hypothetical protein